MSYSMIMQKQKYDEKANVRYLGTDSFIVYIKTGYIYADIAEMLKQGLPLKIMSWTDHKAKNTNVISVMKDELDGKFMQEFLAKT